MAGKGSAAQEETRVRLAMIRDALAHFDALMAEARAPADVARLVPARLELELRDLIAPAAAAHRERDALQPPV